MIWGGLYGILVIEGLLGCEEGVLTIISLCLQICLQFAAGWWDHEPVAASELPCLASSAVLLRAGGGGAHALRHVTTYNRLVCGSRMKSREYLVRIPIMAM